MDTLQTKRLLALLWEYRLFGPQHIAADDGTLVELLDPGHAIDLPDDGAPRPDFQNAAVRFPAEETTLYGAVRVDERSSDWRAEGQIGHPAFDGVTFHVVAQRDGVLMRGGRPVRTLVLTLPPELWQLAQELFTAPAGERSCVNFFSGLEAVAQGQILSRLVADRLRRKVAEIDAIHASLEGDWDETAYVCYLRSLGMGNQKCSYEALARSLPLRYFVGCNGDARQAEALLLGQSGYLAAAAIPWVVDPAIRQLQDIYLSLKREYGLRRPVVSWRGAGVRPVSLPPAQLKAAAALLVQTPRLAARLRSCTGMADLREMFGSSPSDAKRDLRIINFVIPLLTAIGRATRDGALQERAMTLYEEVAPEANRYTRLWVSEGFAPRCAFDSQAVIQLATEYCEPRRCAGCPVGVLRLVRCWRRLCGEGRG